MVHDGTEDGVLILLEGKPESCWGLDVGSAPEDFNVVPRDRVKPLEIHDLLTKAEGFLTAKVGWFAVCWAAVEAWSELAMRGWTISESAAAWVMQSRWPESK